MMAANRTKQTSSCHHAAEKNVFPPADWGFFGLLVQREWEHAAAGTAVSAGPLVTQAGWEYWEREVGRGGAEEQ